MTSANVIDLDAYRHSVRGAGATSTNPAMAAPAPLGWNIALGFVPTATLGGVVFWPVWMAGVAASGSAVSYRAP